MFKLLLVDDKKDLVDGIAAAVHWQEKGVEVFCFYNGKDALAHLLKDPPDMVITDINMPYMSGLELVRAAAEPYPAVRFIVLTGYDEFSYAREALHLGVVEYLSKPVRIEEIEELVMKEKARLTEERKKQKDLADIRVKFNQSLPYIKGRWFQSFIQEQSVISSAALADKFQEMEVPLDTACFHVVLIERDNVYDVAKNPDTSDRKLLLYAIENISKEIMGGSCACEVFQYTENSLVLVCNYKPEVNRIVNHYELYSRLVEIRRNFNEFFGATISIGIGECYEDVEGLRRSFIEAKEALSQKFYFGNNSIISIQDIVKGSPPSQAVYPKELEKTMIQLIKQGELARVEKELDAYFEILKQMKTFVPSSIREHMINFLLKMRSECSAEHGVNIIELLDDFRQQKTLADIKEWFGSYIRYLCEIQDVENTGIRNEILKVREYIDIHYQESITLKKMADYIYISQSYLSFTFKEIMNINFNEYLTKVRIERAKELLESNRYRIYEVCELVGYSDKKHFGELFKKHTGVLPKDWNRKDNEHGMVK